MGMNQTPSSERVHIGFFGRRNAGKSSVMNAVTGQQLAVVSDVKGTTTDPVYKAMELLPLGPVVMIDTPGIDDEGELGALRVKKSSQVLNKSDVAVLVVDVREGIGAEEKQLIEQFERKKIPYLIAYNKADLADGRQARETETEQSMLSNVQAGEAGQSMLSNAQAGEAGQPMPAGKLPETEQTGQTHLSSPPTLYVSASTGQGIRELKEALARLARVEESQKRIVGHLLSPGDLVVLVVPVDKAAPKGRLILPQQQTIRDILDAGAISVVAGEKNLPDTYRKLGEAPALVITDSQTFVQVAKDTPRELALTSFSILFANYKGNLAQAVEGVSALKGLLEGSRILISEGCTHHRQCGDIGTVKLPAWIREYTGKDFRFEFTSGTEFPDDLSGYGLIIHCGGCMLNEREMKYRLQCAADQNVPMTNYGIAIACMKGILKRSLEVFPEIAALLPEDA